MDTPATQRLQSQTIKALEDFLEIWNQDPLATNNSLAITGNQVSVLNETDILISLTLPTNKEPEHSMQEIEPSPLETFFENIETDNLNLLADIEQEEESMQEELSSQNLETEENIAINHPLTRIIDDLTTEKDEVFTRLEPLLGITYKEKLKEIISRLKLESRGKQRDQTIKILEACYYLGQLRETITENQQKTKYTRNALKKSLGPRRADSIWKEAERTYKIF